MKTIMIVVGLLVSMPATSFQFCPPEGKTSSLRRQELNRLKNRTMIPTTYEQFSVLELTQSGEFICDNNKAVKVQGYILDANRSGPETANCHSEVNVDLHVSIVENLGEPKWKSVTVEFTPHFQTADTLKKLRKLRGKKVEFGGYMFYDTEHVKTSWRATACEVHPVTYFKEIN